MTPPNTNILDAYRSHPHKLLRVHMDGVLAKAARRTSSPVARAAALFHDLGKLNPNFDPKLDGKKVDGYSSHAYLSALAFLGFCSKNDFQTALDLGANDVWSVLAIIAHHHGHLPDLRRALSKDHIEKMEAWLDTQPPLPISKYLEAYWEPHKYFDVLDPAVRARLTGCAGITDVSLDRIKDKLAFFQETQFAFAALIEADKRDAGDNPSYKRGRQLKWARKYFSPLLEARFASLTKPGRSELNKVRSKVRRQACKRVRAALGRGERIFSLTAPTGSGKTFTLLALADVIRREKGDLSVIYGLPFLSITEQVEVVCRDEVWCQEPEFVTRVDSRSLNPELERAIEEAERDPSKSAEALREAFSHETFDAAFCVTTFVQIFEALLSNRNATLLRLPNFSRTIFLLDEVQALPPRLYTFFAAYLHEFCERFDCYAVFSTATMPSLSLPARDDMEPELDPHLLFPRYSPPSELLDFKYFYGQSVFNRYRIERIREPLSVEQLADKVREQDKSCLVILNTIEDTRCLHNLLKDEGGCVLLNTRFTLEDRTLKLNTCKEKLAAGERVVLISTQLIEAGVDIDLPVVFRDLCPLPNLIQSAGRCNRNGSPQRGTVFFFELHSESGRPRAELIYRDVSDGWILNFSRRELPYTVDERDLLEVQRRFFDMVNANMEIGKHKLREDKKERRDDNLIRRINEAAFATVGSFRLIDEREFGEEFRFYIPCDEEDESWEQLDTLLAERAEMSRGGRRPPFEQVKLWQMRLDKHLRAMSGRVVTVRCLPDKAPPSVARPNGEHEACGLHKLANLFDYSFERGLDWGGEAFAVL